MISATRWPIPKTWCWVLIKDIAKITDGGTPPADDPGNFSDDDGIPWLTPADLSGNREQYVQRGRRSLSQVGYAKSAAKLLPTGTVLFTSRAPVGYCAIAANPISTNQGFRSLTLFGDISSEYTRYYLILSKRFLEALANGTTFLELSGSKLKQVPFPLPPLAEQRRIVGKLEALFTHSARARTELMNVDTLASRYRETLLGQTFGGIAELTRGTSTLRRLSDVCHKITDGDHRAPPRSACGVPLITISCMSNGRIDFGKATRFVPQSYYDELREASKAKLGDILYSVTGSFGISAMIKFQEDFVFQRHIAILKPDKKVVMPEYLNLLLISPQVKVQADAAASGTVQKTISLKSLRNFTIPVPSLEKQQEIVRNIALGFSKIDRLVAESKRAEVLLSRLDDMILLKAFRGELLPQNENDESVSKMIERIRDGKALPTLKTRIS